MKNITFYKGFEGEPSLKLSQKDKDGIIKTELLLWVGYFDEILQLINPSKDGNWEGVTKFYHTETGWYDESLWKCDDLELFLGQLKSINVNSLEEKTKNVYHELFSMLEDCVVNENELYFEYD